MRKTVRFLIPCLILLFLVFALSACGGTAAKTDAPSGADTTAQTDAAAEKEEAPALSHDELVEKALADLEHVVAVKDSVTYLTREQVLEKFNVDPSTLWRWAQRGYLVPVKVGGDNRYKSTDIDRILEG